MTSILCRQKSAALIISILQLALLMIVSRWPA
jgi:hypothetical protein